MMVDMSRAKSPRIVAVYCRVSHEDQAASGLGLESQEARCRAYVDAMGLAENGAEVRLFVDAGISGATMSRPALQELLGLVASRKVEAVIVAKIDRVSRKLRDLLDIVDTLTSKSVAFHCVSERVDTSTAMGRAMLSLLGTFAEFEREQIRERTRSAAAAKRARGEAWGFDPLGAEAVRGRLQAVASEVEAVDLMVRRRAEGASLRQIARELEAGNYETKRGGKWRACTVDVVLRRVERDQKGAAA